MRLRISCLSAATLLISATALAQAQFTPPTFDGIDKNKDGKLSKDEVAAWVKTLPPGPNGPRSADEVFARWDTNKDGSVSKEEFDNRPRGGQGQGPGGGAGGGPPK